MASRVYPKAVTDKSLSTVTPSPNFPQMEESVLKYWDVDDTFRKSIVQRSNSEAEDEFIFFDGPPFANGLPHYGHLLTGYAKDVVPRFQTMMGKKVNRVFGWDTHGLPAEIEAEKELGIEDKSQIDDMGIRAFNEACRRSVLKYTQEWKDYVHRQARWVDFDNGYKTLDTSYMESVIWAFKQLYDKGLAYQGYRVLPYCWKDETPLSNHELRMDADVYQDRQDNTLSVAMKLRDEDAYVVIWTTTAWTLPSNQAIVVGGDIDYVEVEPVEGPFAGKRMYFAKELVGRFAKELGEDYKVVRELKGKELEGRRYWPAFDYFLDGSLTSRDGQPDEDPNAFTIYVADYVEATDGTGLVHQAVYGEDDINTLNKYHIRTLDVLDEGACYTSAVPDYEGVQAFEANKLITRHLRAGEGPLERIPAENRAFIVQEKSHVHSYPHCWRCATPLIYKPVSSWFVSVTKFKDRLLELNQEINWIPDNVKDGQFGKWLENARDWSISRNRYWGSPIPVWVSDDPQYPHVDVYGSLEEIKRDFGTYPLDDKGEVNLHRPWIDELTRPNPADPTGKSVMRRIPDVLDCWFESGSMPFAQFHYPFENKEYFEERLPSDYVVEYIGQTRGWFYTLHIMSTALFDRPAFKNVICHGIVLGDDGQKMSKHLRNYPDVSGVFNQYGSDAMRWFLMGSPILRGGNLIVTADGIRDTVRQIMLPLWSTYYFFTLYANAAHNSEGYEARILTPEDIDALSNMDRYLLARTRTLVETVQQQLSEYAIAEACTSVSEFIDSMTNWYIRNSRDSFWSEDHRVFDTLYTVLEVLTRVMAPLAPMEAETVWRGLTGGESVHLTDWPFVVDNDGKETDLGRVLRPDDELVETMEKVREIVSSTLGLRKVEQIRVRQPLSKLTVVADDIDAIADYESCLVRELNVKSVEYTTVDQASAHGLNVVNELRVNAREAGPRLGKLVQQVIRASKNDQWHVDADGRVVVDVENESGEPIVLHEGEYELISRVEVAAGSAAGSAEGASTASCALPTGGFVILDTVLTDDLVAEGYARDAIRTVQDARKTADFDIADRIRLVLRASEDDTRKLEQFSELIAAETLAVSVSIEMSQSGELEVEVEKAEA